MTRQEILNDFPSFENCPNIVEKLYGDEPSSIYDAKEYMRYEKLTDRTLINLETVEAYIFVMNGTYYAYDTLIGKVKIAKDGRVLCGQIHIKYGGRTYDVDLIKMYGYNGLDILRLGNGVTGFSNKDGCGSPSSARFTKELDDDVIEHIINRQLSDYGIGIQKFMEAVRETYKQDTANYIMEKCFDC